MLQELGLKVDLHSEVFRLLVNHLELTSSIVSVIARVMSKLDVWDLT